MNRKFRLFTVLALVLIFTVFSSKAIAGWVEVNKFNGTAYISGGMLKQVRGGESAMWALFDVNRGTITMVEPGDMSYMEFYPDEFCDQLSSMMDAMMKAAPPEQRAAMEQMMGAQGAAIKTPTVKVTKLGSGGKIAGFDTDKYSVTVDGNPYKEIWLATNAPIMDDVKVFIKSALDMNKKMEGCTQMGAVSVTLAALPESTEEYMSLMEKGWSMKEVDMRSGKVSSEVESLEKRDIPASEFTIPQDYKKIDMMEMLSQMGK